MTDVYRARRSCLAVPGSSPRFVAKARCLPADEIFLDLEDSVAPAVKDEARERVVEALNAGGWDSRLMAVRVNDAGTRWAFRDVIEVVSGAGRHLDAIILPKVRDPGHIVWLDTLLGQLERETGDEVGRIGIEAQIEDASGLAAVDAIGAASRRLRALVFGPADFMASIGMRSLRVGQQPEGYVGGDAYHYPLLRILVAARSRGLAAIDGPYLAIGDTAGLRRSAASSAALGYDGKWVVHPGQIDVVNAAFSPGQEEFERAELILDAYEYSTRVDKRGAVMLGEEMIDEASRKLALVTAAKGRAAGLRRTRRFDPPPGAPIAPAARTAPGASTASRPSAGQRPAPSAEHPPGDEYFGKPAGQW